MQVMPESKIPLVDLRSICRDADRFYCEVGFAHEEPWLKLGRIRLYETGYRWTLGSYLRDGATDEEEDSAYACQLGLVDLRLSFVNDHHFLYEAWLSPDPDDFRVPTPNYNPFTDPSTALCERCDNHHAVVANFVPPRNLSLFKFVRNRRITIRIGPVESAGDESASEQEGQEDG